MYRRDENALGTVNLEEVEPGTTAPNRFHGKP
jgi:hypothetical protein